MRVFPFVAPWLRRSVACLAACLWPALCILLAPTPALGGPPDPLTRTYAYDHNGNMTGRDDGTNADTFTYDFENQLVAADIQSAEAPGPVTFAYDADNIRTGKAASGATTHYVADKNRDYAQVLVERETPTVGDPIAAAYTHGHNLISMNRANLSTHHYHHDGQTSVRALTNANTVASDAYTHDAFGTIKSNSGFTPNNYRYRSEQYDPDLDQYYLRARYYDPARGRFCVRDPAEPDETDPRTANTYAYANADPMNTRDPSGQFGLSDVMTAVAIYGILASMPSIAAPADAPQPIKQMPVSVHYDKVKWTRPMVDAAIDGAKVFYSQQFQINMLAGAAKPGNYRKKAYQVKDFSAVQDGQLRLYFVDRVWQDSKNPGEELAWGAQGGNALIVGWHATNCPETWPTVAHEIGHTFDLHHEDGVVNFMYKAATCEQGTVRPFQKGDARDYGIKHKRFAQ